MISKLLFTGIFIYLISKSDQTSNILHNSKESSIIFNINRDHIENTIELILKIVINFNTDFAVTFHYENNSMYLINNVIKNLNTSKIICGVYNYDQLLEISSLKNQRCIQYSIHVVLLNDPKKISLISKSDILIIFLYNNKMIRDYNDLVNEKLLKKTFAVFYLELQRDKTTLYDICFYCGNRSKKLTKLATVDYGYHSELISTLKTCLSRKKIDFNGHIFKLPIVFYDSVSKNAKNSSIVLPNGVTLHEINRKIPTKNYLIVFKKGINAEFQMIKGYKRQFFDMMDNDSLADLSRDILDMIPCPGKIISSDKFTFFICTIYSTVKAIYVISDNIMDSSKFNIILNIIFKTIK